VLGGVQNDERWELLGVKPNARGLAWETFTVINFDRFGLPTCKTRLNG